MLPAMAGSIFGFSFTSVAIIRAPIAPYRFGFFLVVAVLILVIAARLVVVLPAILVFTGYRSFAALS
jgi:hypothetical protein